MNSTTAATLHPTAVSSPAHGTRPTLGNPAAPSAAEYSEDIDAVLERDEVCVAWSGFYHAEEVKLEVGMGTGPDQDDVAAFRPVEKNHHRGPICVNLTTSAPVYTMLFSVVRATNSGDTSLFSSDGFVLIPAGDVTKNVKVFAGEVCTSADVLGSLSVNRTATELDLSSLSAVALHTGDTLFLQFSPFVSNVTFADAVLLQTTLTGYQIVVTSPAVKAHLPPAPASRNTTTSVQVKNCLKDAILLRAPQDHVAVTWETLGQWTRHVKALQVEVVDSTCLTTLPKKEKYRQQRCLITGRRLNRAETVLRVDGRDLVNGHTYFATVSPSFDDGFLPPVSSQYFTCDSSHRSLTFQRADIASQASQDLEVDIQAMVQPSVSSVAASGGHEPCLVKWAVARDRFGSTLLADWRIAEFARCSDVEVSFNWFCTIQITL